MAFYEYKVIPAPSKGRKARGIKRPEARFAFGLQQVMNEAAAEGWEYLRADILPSEERQGLTSTHTVYRSVLVFRRVLDEARQTDTDTATGVTDEDAGANDAQQDDDARSEPGDTAPHDTGDAHDDAAAPRTAEAEKDGPPRFG